MECPLSKEELAMWKHNPLTSKVFQAIFNYRRNLQESLGQGASLDLNSLERTGLKTAKMQGVCEGLSIILSIESEKGEDNE
jgi:hypothetical protein